MPPPSPGPHTFQIEIELVERIGGVPQILPFEKIFPILGEWNTSCEKTHLPRFRTKTVLGNVHYYDAARSAPVHSPLAMIWGEIPCSSEFDAKGCLCTVRNLVQLFQTTFRPVSIAMEFNGESVPIEH